MPWRVIWAEVSRRREFTFSTPDFRILDEDRASGLLRRDGGDRAYWLPEQASEWGLNSMYREVFNPYQPHYYEFAGCTIRPGDVVVDAGACEGFFTWFALQRGARVIAIEPWSRMADALRRTFREQIERGTLIVERALLTDACRESTLRYDPEWPFGASVTRREGEPGEFEPVPEVTVDALIERSPWGRCDFLKMDIEGCELQALRGATGTLRRDRPHLSLAAYHSAEDYLQFTRFVSELGLGYRTAGKGILQMPGDNTWRPQMFHAWCRTRPVSLAGAPRA